MRARRSSLRVTLVLAGTATLYACGDSEPRYVNRDVYASAADCQRDWGQQSCQQNQPASSTGTRSSVWYGPSYYSNRARPQGSRAITTSSTSNFTASSVSRGGFGSSSSFHSSGG